MGYYYLLTLGCPKNQVDSEYLQGILAEEGFLETQNPEDSDLILINTCGFIEDAQKESIEEILLAARYQKPLWVLGCLSQKFGEELKKEIPEISVLLGTGIHKELKIALQAFKEKKGLLEYTSIAKPFSQGDYPLRYRKGKPSHTRYLKIAEGCDTHCSYCAIPGIRGPYKSRAYGELLEESHKLVEEGARELVLIAQDTGRYGLDRKEGKTLTNLVADLALIRNLEWIRIMYLQPSSLQDDLLKVLAEKKKICKYLDIPLQHVNGTILQTMNRQGSREQLQRLIEKIRLQVPQVALRTSLMVGFPGEGEEEFSQLLAFLKEAAFDRLGVFLYSPQEGTRAYELGDPISQATKEQRYYQILKAQQTINESRNRAMEGKVFPVLIDEVKGSQALGRTQWDAPDIDQVVYVENGNNLKQGNFYRVRIELGLEFELVGEIVHEPAQ